MDNSPPLFFIKTILWKANTLSQVHYSGHLFTFHVHKDNLSE